MPDLNAAVRRTFGLNWPAAIGAGIIAGVAFLILEMGLLATTGGAVWGPPRMMAAIVMGEGVLPPPATYAPGIVAVGMIVHFVLSIIYAIILAAILQWWPLPIWPAVGLGAAFGLLIFLVNFYGFTELAFPWFAMARNWITLVSHIVFGAVLGGSYKLIAARQEHAPGHA